jgi:hypothetical protein
MPDCILKTFGFVSRSEKKLNKRLRRRIDELIAMEPASPALSRECMTLPNHSYSHVRSV